MKKTVTAAALIAALIFAGIQTGSANNNRYYNDNSYGPSYCGTYSNDSRPHSEEDRSAFIILLTVMAEI